VIKPIQRFYQAIKSEETRKPYEYYLKKFFNHAKIDSDEIVNLSDKETDDLVFNYLVSLKMRVDKSTLSPNSINAMMSPIQLFLEQNDISLNWKKIKRMYPRRAAPANQAPYHEEDGMRVIKELVKTKTLIYN